MDSHAHTEVVLHWTGKVLDVLSSVLWIPYLYPIHFQHWSSPPWFLMVFFSLLYLCYTHFVSDTHLKFFKNWCLEDIGLMKEGGMMLSTWYLNSRDLDVNISKSLILWDSVFLLSNEMIMPGSTLETSQPDTNCLSLVLILFLPTFIDFS